MFSRLSHILFKAMVRTLRDRFDSSLVVFPSVSLNCEFHSDTKELPLLNKFVAAMLSLPDTCVTTGMNLCRYDLVLV